ncbi:MAG: ribose 1,5-bisphosphate isomerase [Candidatus Nanohalarchaeota archaeon]|nr:MAG: ribose 1,5-bisphosphate isomerase [Candidatus Nanohaloarchaeota archaeon]
MLLDKRMFMSATANDDRVRKIMRDIKAIKIQGARKVAVAGARILMIVAQGSHAKSSREFVSELGMVSREVVGLRPTEPALRFGQELIVSKVASRKRVSVGELRRYAVLVCRHYIYETKKMLDKIAQYGARLISDGDVVMTHCHSHCVVEILRFAKRQGKDFSVIVTETRPLLQGKITARELLAEKIPVVYCVDSASASLMKDATKVLVGADAVTAGGDVVNKIGTYQIAIEARAYKVPFIVACGTHKYDAKTALGFPEPIEERGRTEVSGARELTGAKVVNPAFDVTPKEYVYEIVTEIGVFSPETLVGVLVSHGKNGGDLNGC